MAYEIVKFMLERARTFRQRLKAIRIAILLGMPLRDIEEFLDWLDAT